MKKMLSLMLALMLVLSIVPGVYAEAAPTAFTYMTITSDVWSVDDAPMQEAMRLTNTDITFELAPLDTYTSSLQTMLAGGTLPDVIQFRGAEQLNVLLDQEVLLPLETLIEEHAPNILAFFGEDVWKQAKAAVGDGHVYYIPFASTTPLTQSWMMRKDWLDRCGLEVPNTWEEWVNALKAFKEMDANGNGDATDEIPLSGVVDKLLYTFDIYNNDIFCLNPEGSYSLIYDHPNYKAYLETMADLYANGLLDKEYLDRNSNANEANLKAAMANDLIGACFTYMNNMHDVDAIEGAQYIYMAPPVGPYGTQKQPGRTMSWDNSNSAAITIAAEDKAVELIKYFDWLFSEEGQMVFSFGVEGVSYDIVDGQPKLRPEFTVDFPTYRAWGMNYQPITHVWRGDAYVQVFTKGMSEEEMDHVSRQFSKGAVLNENEHYGVATVPTFSTPAYVEYYADLNAQVKSLEAQVIAGNITVDDFFAKYEELKGEGLQDIIDEAAAAYDAMMK